MLKKTLTFQDLNSIVEGDEDKEDFTPKMVTEDFYFNLTTMEIIEINLINDLKEVGRSNDPRRIIPTLKRIVRAAVGRKIEGKYVKSEDFADEFIASDAYSKLFTEILQSEEPEKRMALFIKGIVPADYDPSVQSLETK